MPEYDWDDCVDWIETLRETTHLQWIMPGNEDYVVIYVIFNGSDSSTPNAEYQDRFSKWFTNIGGDKIFDITVEDALTVYWSKSEPDTFGERTEFTFRDCVSYSSNWVNTPHNCMSILFF